MADNLLLKGTGIKPLIYAIRAHAGLGDLSHFLSAGNNTTKL